MGLHDYIAYTNLFIYKTYIEEDILSLGFKGASLHDYHMLEINHKVRISSPHTLRQSCHVAHSYGL